MATEVDGLEDARIAATELRNDAELALGRHEELGSVALSDGDPERAQSLYEEAVELFERENVPVRLAVVLANLAAIATMRGDLDTATAYAGRAAALQREVHDSDGFAVTLHNFVRILMAQGRVDDAREAIRESMELARTLDYREVLAYGLETSAELAFALGDDRRAARLLGACDSAFESLGIVMAAEEAEGYARVLGELRVRSTRRSSTSCTPRGVLCPSRRPSAWRSSCWLRSARVRQRRQDLLHAVAQVLECRRQ